MIILCPTEGYIDGPLVIEEDKITLDIGKDWKITADSMNITLSKRITRKDKTGIYYEAWVNEGYYPDVKSALKGLVEHGVKETELRDLKTIVSKIEELRTLIDRASKSLQDISGGLR